MLDSINNTEKVRQQYADDKNLSSRMGLYAKHSTNKQGFANWLWEQYRFSDGCRVLELGCGNGAQWENKAGALPAGCGVVLSDFSEGMVKIVREKYGQSAGYELFSFRQIDIQDIDFPDETFDIVIANHMLYHVPDLDKALSEVRRVLKKYGTFYSSTNGNGGMWPFFHNAFRQIDPRTKMFTNQFSFSLENGYDILRTYFFGVKKLEYKDSLAVTETEDLMVFLRSVTGMASYSEKDLEGLFDYFEDIRKRDGAINIPKEAGLFISVK